MDVRPYTQKWTFNPRLHVRYDRRTKKIRGYGRWILLQSNRIRYQLFL